MVYLAVDLSAERCILVKGHLSADGRIDTEIVHSFHGYTGNADKKIVWDIDGIYAEIILGLKKAGKVDCIAIDSNGFEFVLSDEEGNPIAEVETFNGELEGIPDEAFVFRKTGLRKCGGRMINALLALKMKSPEILEKAAYLLSIPEYIVYRLTGIIKHEYTFASVSGLLDPDTRSWDHELIDGFGLPVHLFADLSDPGTEVGRIRGDVADRIGYSPMVLLAPSYAPSALVAGLPKDDEGFFVLLDDSVTVGALSDHPLLDSWAYEAGLSNVGGQGRDIIVTKTFPGLGLLKEHGDIASVVEKARGIMACDAFDLSSSQKVPEKCESAASIIGSISSTVRNIVKELEQALGKKAGTIAVAGEGISYFYLIELIAMNLGIPVISSDRDAAFGNIVSQMLRNGEIQQDGIRKAGLLTIFRRI